MNLPTIFLLAAALGTDAMSMAVGVGIYGVRLRQIILVSSTVCLFHIIMPLAGLTLGAVLGRAVGDMAGLIGAVVLIVIGVRGLIEIYGKRIAPAPSGSAGGTIYVAGGMAGLIVLAGSVSLDALTVGFGLGAYDVNLPLTVAVFGIVAGIMTAIGFLSGRRLRGWLGGRAEIIGSVILVVIGVKMLLG